MQVADIDDYLNSTANWTGVDFEPLELSVIPTSQTEVNDWIGSDADGTSNDTFETTVPVEPDVIGSDDVTFIVGIPLDTDELAKDNIIIEVGEDLGAETTGGRVDTKLDKTKTEVTAANKFSALNDLLKS